ncbi:hypothetical protein C7957_14314 [Halanaerobium saccharolyticum]|jgi:hypothetical protein|uniref:Uncharacterized protein n=1 Tax=Halanaerobium saccharolyticum TaxID=43595 RepID=A0A4R6RCP6_9FIRM|nr:hypothetical protein [Halanaerobium saccharolyticum]TDP83889.1 hypothetical protein C7957_14314 [Halanaerobium saccharolyticum]
MSIDRVDSETIRPDNFRDINNLKELIELRIEASLDKLIEKDKHLVDTKTNERSLTHRLGMYLQNLFEYWDVDCEYNRDGNKPKRINWDIEPEEIESTDTQGKTVYPDIIIHQRGKQSTINLAVIEVKKTDNFSRSEVIKDIKKLIEYKNSHLNYEFACFIKINVSEEKNEKPYNFYPVETGNSTNEIFSEICNQDS